MNTFPSVCCRSCKRSGVVPVQTAFDHFLWEVPLMKPCDFMRLSMRFCLSPRMKTFCSLASDVASPPKVICLIIGYVSNAVIADCLLRNAKEIEWFVRHPEAGFLLLGLNPTVERSRAMGRRRSLLEKMCRAIWVAYCTSISPWHPTTPSPPRRRLRQRLLDRLLSARQHIRRLLRPGFQSIRPGSPTARATTRPMAPSISRTSHP